MKVLLGYQDLIEVIKNDVNPFVKGDTTKHKDEKTKNFKALYLIH